MSDKDKDQSKANDLEAEFRKLVIDELRSIGGKQDTTTTSVNDLKTDLKLHQQESNMRWQAIEELDREQNAILSEHHARSTAIQADVALRDKALRHQIFGSQGLEERVVALEEPSRVKKYIKDNIIMIAKVAGAIVTIAGAVAWFMGLF